MLSQKKPRDAAAVRCSLKFADIHYKIKSSHAPKARLQSYRAIASDLSARYVFELIAAETWGVFNASARHPVDDLGTWIPLNSGEATETSYLCQRISVLVQRVNDILL